MGFRCYHCDLENESQFNILGHSILQHGQKELAFKEYVCTDERSGYQSKHFKIIPDEVRRDGKTIWIRPDKAQIHITCTQECPCEPVLMESKSTCTTSTICTTENCDTISCALDKMPEKDRNAFVNFFLLIGQDKFPLHNMAYNLFLDVIRWFAAEDISSFRYGNQSKQFWRIGYFLFRGKFLNFMRGLGFQDQRRTGITNFDPADSRINFAVPTRQMLTSATSFIPKQVLPGIIMQILEQLSVDPESKSKSWKVCVDLKKINSNKSDAFSSVDLWGFEDEPTKEERNIRLVHDIEILSKIRNKVSNLEDLLENSSFTVPNSQEIKDKMRESVGIIGGRIKDLRVCLKGKTDLLQSLIEKAAREGFELDWRKSKFSYAISSVKTYILSLQECINGLLNSGDKMTHYLSFASGNQHLFEQGYFVQLSEQENYSCLDETLENGNARFIKQRSEEWFNLRRQAKVTASTMSNAIGFQTLKKQQAHYDSVILKISQSNLRTDAMQHGLDNEENGIATLVAKILPAFFPNIQFHEVGSYVVFEGGKPLIVASPDGEGRDGDRVKLLFEIKCPFNSTNWKTPVHYSIPDYYIPQLLCQMGASKSALGYTVSETVFISWSEESSTVFHVEFDEELWGLMEKEVMHVFANACPKRPTRKSEKVVDIRKRVSEFKETHVTFIGEFKSVKGQTFCNNREYQTHNQLRSRRNDQHYHLPLVEVKREIENTIQLIQTQDTLVSQRSTDVIVFMLSDLDRTCGIKPYVYPVAYGMSPKNIKAEQVRSMLDYLRYEGKQLGIDICAEAFDGQFCSIALKTRSGCSLTKLQEMKCHWKDVCRKSKQDMLNLFTKLGTPERSDNDPNVLKRQICDNWSSQENSELKGKITLTYRNLSNALSLPQQNNIICSWTHALRVVEVQETSESITSTRESNIIDETGLALIDDDYHTFQHSLSLNATPKRQPKWNNMSRNSFQLIFTDVEKINNNFTKQELQILLKCCPNSIIQHAKRKGLKQTNRKSDFVNFFSELAGNSMFLVDARNKVSPKSLKQMIRDKMKQVKKDSLNKISAELLWPKKEKDWRKQQQDLISVEKLRCLGFETKHDWFSYPDAEDKRNIFRFLDHHHLLTNCRAHCCRKGFPALGIKASAWLKIAKNCKENGTGLNPAFVEDLVDIQSNAIARLTFSLPVEQALCQNGDNNEGHFCKLIREWYEAVDEKGIPAQERVRRLMNLREFLLDCHYKDETQFPPPTTHVAGIPVVLFSGLLLSCERLIQLYKEAKNGTYNARSIGSLDNETFFSSFRDLDPRGAGVLKPGEIPRAMSVSCEILMTKLDPNRGFYFHTTNSKPVYPVQTMDIRESDDTDSSSTNRVDIDDNPFQNHPYFDKPAIRPSKRKVAKISPIDSSAQGSQGIRQYHKMDEDKILPHKRACLDIDMKL